MAAIGTCGEWFLSTSDKKLIAIHTKLTRDPFVFDCSTAEQRPKDTETDSKSDGSEEAGSDRILALAVSSSGKLVAVTDDNKRLVLFSTEPAWQVVSTRWVVRRCTALVFSQAEEELLAADKSGDVFSFSTTELRRPGELRLGHLSMLLAMTLTPDDKYIITADRDEKIRVSHLKSPYNIQSFCLGHLEFVSSLLVPPAHADWLLSGSGDGTLKLWDFHSGRRIQSWDLKQLRNLGTVTEATVTEATVTEATVTEADEEKRSAVSRIAGSLDGRHVAVQCERVPVVQLFGLEGAEQRLVPSSKLRLPHPPLDLTFDLHGRLWVLLDSPDAPVQTYTHTPHRWECDGDSVEVNRVTAALKPHCEALQASGTESRFQHLYKASFDNMAAYLEKKQQRLQQQHEHWGKKRSKEEKKREKEEKKREKEEKKRGNSQQTNGSNKKARSEEEGAEASTCC